MPRGLPKLVRDNLEKCRESAIAAVDAYNRPGPRFRAAQYTVLIIIAWTAYFHAVFYRRRVKPWYKARNGRYERVDGDPKHWDISKCLSEYFAGASNAERSNLEFLIGLRNKIEHRHLPQLDPSLFGECQAALMNLEEHLVRDFGERYALVDQLAVSLQFSRQTPDEKRLAARILASSDAKGVADYIERYRGRLPSTVLNSTKYSFNVFLVPKVANRQSAADAAVTFVRVDEASSEEISRLDVNAGAILDHVAEVKVDHLNEDGGFWTADADSGARCGDSGVKPSRHVNQGDRSGAGYFPCHGSALFV